MTDLDEDENARETFETLFNAADDDHSNRISYEELVEAAWVSDEWGHNLCREEAVIMADAMFARVAQLFPEREEGADLSFVEFVRATGASIRETAENVDELHEDVVAAQNARLNNTLRAVASKKTLGRISTVSKFMKEEGLGAIGGEGLEVDDESEVSMNAIEIIQRHAQKLSEMEDLTLQKDQQIFELQDNVKEKYSQIESLKKQRMRMAEKADEYQDRIQELEMLLSSRDTEYLDETKSEIEKLKEASKWAMEKQQQQLEELQRQTRQAEEQRNAAAAEAAAISKRMAVQHVFSRAAAKSKRIELDIQTKRNFIKLQTENEDIERLKAEVEAHELELKHTQQKMNSLKQDRTKLIQMQDKHSKLVKENKSVKKLLSQAKATAQQEHQDLMKMSSMHEHDVKEMETLKERFKELERDGKQKELEILKISMGHKAQDIAEWRSQIDSAEKRKLELQSEIERLKLEDNETIKKLHDEKLAQEKENELLHQENSKREADIKDLKKRMDKEHKEYLRLKHLEEDHEEQNAKVEELQNEYSKLQKHHLAKKESFHMKLMKEKGLIESLRRELAESKRHETQLEEKEASLEKLNHDLQKNNEKLLAIQSDKDTTKKDVDKSYCDVCTIS